MLTVEPADGGTPACYRALEARLAAVKDYEIVLITPEETDGYSSTPRTHPETLASARKRRCRFRDGLAFSSFAVKRYVYVAGGQESAVLILWKLPSVAERSETEDAGVHLRIRSMLPVYHTRIMKREFVRERLDVIQGGPS